MRGKPVSASSVILSRVMHPNDASFMGTVHGGVILRMLDEAGGMAAFRHARKPVVTAAIDSMSFLAPVYVGNLVTAKASVNLNPAPRLCHHNGETAPGARKKQERRLPLNLTFGEVNCRTDKPSLYAISALCEVSQGFR